MSARERDDDDTIVVITGGASVADGETVDGVYVLDGPVTIAGTVDGDVVVVNGDTEISGEVGGDVTVLAKRAVIASGARIGGDRRCGDEEPEIASGAQIDGDVKKGGRTFRPSAGSARSRSGSRSALLAGARLALLLIAPRAADAAYLLNARTPGDRSRSLRSSWPCRSSLSSRWSPLSACPLGIAVLLALLPLGAIAAVATLWVVGRLVLKRARVASPRFSSVGRSSASSP